MSDNFEKKPRQRVSDEESIKWVWAALGLGMVIMVLLIWSSLITKDVNLAEAEIKARLQDNQSQNMVDATYDYDFDLVLSPQNCEGVSGQVDMVLITDANYMDFTRVAINSAKETKCPGSVYNFYVMTSDISQSDEAALKALEGENVSITIMPQKEIDLFYIRETHVSKASLLKYYIAEMLPELDKVLYLDTDILVLHDLTKLYQTDIDDVYLAAVKDPSWFFENTHVLELNLEYRGFYFNSGVMLMNLKKFREDGLLKELEDYTNNNFRTYMDQDALNVVVGDKVKLLPFEDNAMYFFFEHVDLPVMGDFYGRNWQSYEDVFAPVTILHFASSKKPLGPLAPNDQFFHMLQRLWYKYYTPLPPLD